MTYDYFVSFSNIDAEIITEIVRVIENFGAKCWFQKNNSKQEYAQAIMNGIHSSSVFLVFVSQASANSMAVLNEIDCAIKWHDKNRDYKILPVVLHSCNLENSEFDQINYYLGRLNMLFEDNFSTLEQLVMKIFSQTDFKTNKAETSLYHSSSIEDKRLTLQNLILADFAKSTFEGILTPSSYVLDVGCANGNFITECLNGLPYEKLLGVDIEEEKINEANNKFASDKNSFIVGNITEEAFQESLDGFLDDQNVRGFDVINISHVLLHLEEPARLLKVLKRYLTKTGYLVIHDEDDGAALVYPDSKFFQNAFYLWELSKMSGDRSCGRKISSYLQDAGYKNINLAKCGINNMNLPIDYKPALWDLYFNYHLWGVLNENLFKDPINSERALKEYKADYDKIKEEYDNDKIFLQLGFMLWTAQK